MPFLPPNQQRQSTEGTKIFILNKITVTEKSELQRAMLHGIK